MCCPVVPQMLGVSFVYIGCNPRLGFASLHCLDENLEACIVGNVAIRPLVDRLNVASADEFRRILSNLGKVPDHLIGDDSASLCRG